VPTVRTCFLLKCLGCLISWIAVGQSTVHLHVEAVNPFSGAIMPAAHVIVQSPDKKVVCEGRMGTIDCFLPAGSYSVKALRAGYSSNWSQVILTDAPTYRKVALWLEDPVDFGPVGHAGERSQSRTGRIIDTVGSTSAKGCWIRVAAVHDSFQDQRYTASNEFIVSRMKPGLYQLAVTCGSENTRSFLLNVQPACSAFDIPLSGDTRKIDCQ
jgi:hypothetical protein